MNEWLGLAISYFFIFAVIGTAQLLLRTRIVGPSGSRKIVHIGVAHWWIIAMLFFEQLWIALIGPVSFIAINAWSWRTHFFAAMEHGDHRKNLGTIWFPVALTGLVLLTWGGAFPRWYGLLAILVLGWGDGLAAVVGERLGRRDGAQLFPVPGGTKSVAGTLSALLASGAVTATIVWLFTGPLATGTSSVSTAAWGSFLEGLRSLGAHTWVARSTDHTVLRALSRLDGLVRLVAEHAGTDLVDPARWKLAPTGIIAIALIVATAATAAELLTPWGIDNITIPFVTFFVIAVLLTLPAEWVIRLAWALGLNLLGAGVAYLRRSLTAGGAITGTLLGSLIFLAGGGFYWSVLMAFFFSSSFLSRITSSRKRAAETISEKGGRRDALQVCANGGLATIMATAHVLTGSPVFMFGFAIALAAANADTWASEIGVLSRGEPVSILNLQPVPRGTSGGISVLGLFASASGAMFIALWFAVGYGVFGYRAGAGWSLFEMGAIVAMITGGGVLGSLVDSFLGATVQAQYWDGLRGVRTERSADARGRPNRLMRGWALLNNNAVNALSGLVATVALVLLVTS